MKKFLCFVATLLCVSAIEAKVSLAQLFQSGMVLQRGKSIPIWGKAETGELVTIRFNNKQYVTTADLQGNWRVNLPKMKAGGPYTMTVGDIVLTNILIGDVWLLSGQSNIDVTIERVYPQYTKEIDTYENPNIRLFRVQNETAVHGVKEDIRPTTINWKPVNKENAWFFSAVGYFLGKRMYEKTHVAQGIIVNSWGGTPIEAWISADSLREDYPQLVKRAEFFQNDNYVKAQAQANMEADRQWQKILKATDPGILDDWTSPSFDDSQWQTVSQWDTKWAVSPTTYRPVVGTIWLRQHINIDKAHAGKPARLLLGTLFDQDFTYLNGQQIGHTGYQYPPRRYDIPEGLLREGDNVITVLFINKYGLVHFIPEKPYLIAFGEDRFSQNPMPSDVLPLSESWQMKIGAEMPNCPSGDISLQNIPTTLYNAVVYPLAATVGRIRRCHSLSCSWPTTTGVSRQASPRPSHRRRHQSTVVGQPFVKPSASQPRTTPEQNWPSSMTLVRPLTSIRSVKRKWQSVSVSASTVLYIIIRWNSPLRLSQQKSRRAPSSSRSTNPSNQES